MAHAVRSKVKMLSWCVDGWERRTSVERGARIRHVRAVAHSPSDKITGHGTLRITG